MKLEKVVAILGGMVAEKNGYFFSVIRYGSGDECFVAVDYLNSLNQKCHLTFIETLKLLKHYVG